MPHVSRLARRIASALAVSALLGSAAAGVAAPAGAQTAGSCSGSVSGHRTVSVGGTVIAEIVVYYQAGSGGTNTACTYHRGPAYGVATDTMVQLGECSRNDCTYAFDGGQFMRDADTYAKFAGPVRRTSTDGNCVIAEGRITWRGQPYVWSTGRVGCP